MTNRRIHPSVFMVLILPFGAMSGYLSVAVAYGLAHQGVSVEKIAALVGLSLLPHTWKFLWAPIADTMLSRKAWYVLAGGVSAAGIFALGAVPADAGSLPLLSAIVLTSNLAVTFLGMAVESLMAYTTPEEEKGRVGGWFQAGNLGGLGVGGGAGLWLTQHVDPHWLPGAIVGAACFLCCGALIAVPEPPPLPRGDGLARSMAFVGKDLWAVARSRLGFAALLLCFLPLGSGAASNLWSAVSDDWHASVNAVALSTGMVAGLASALGSIAGGWICDRMDRKNAYAAYGVLQALCAAGMAMAPRTPAAYVAFTLVYAFISGLTYAGFSAFTLEAMGRGAAATKYSLFASLSNMPIYYMTLVDGWAHARWGSTGMLYTEAAFGMAGLVVFIGLVLAMRGRGKAPAEIEGGAEAPLPDGAV